MAMWQTILVIAIVLAAAAVVAWRTYRALTGRTRCNCPKAPHCPAAGKGPGHCDDPPSA